MVNLSFMGLCADPSNICQDILLNTTKNETFQDILFKMDDLSQ